MQAFISVTKTVRRSIGPLKISARRPVADRPGAAACAFCHTSGSLTLRRTQAAARAGRMPTKNAARQPQTGSTSCVTMAAAAKPTAQELCTIPSALPRCSAGQVSDTSAAPHAHSPPMPIPSKARKTIKCHAVCARPQAPVKIE